MYLFEYHDDLPGEVLKCENIMSVNGKCLNLILYVSLSTHPHFFNSTLFYVPQFRMDYFSEKLVIQWIGHTL